MLHAFGILLKDKNHWHFDDILYFDFFDTADRAKQIKTKAIVNEDPTEALIRELKEQNEKLKMQLQTGKVDTKDLIAMSDNDNVSPEGTIYTSIPL